MIWKQDVAREIAGGRGETLFGGAVDSEKAYFGLISSGHLALDLKTGEEVWYAPLVPPQGRENQRGVVGAVTLIPGVLLSGARDGMIRAASSRTGQLLWEFDSAKEFTTVNGSARPAAVPPRRADRLSPTGWCSSDRAIRASREDSRGMSSSRSRRPCGSTYTPMS